MAAVSNQFLNNESVKRYSLYFVSEIKTQEHTRLFIVKRLDVKEIRASFLTHITVTSHYIVLFPYLLKK